MHNPHNIQDLLSDQSFRAWVLNDAQSDTDGWDLYLKKHPQELDTINKATYILKSISFQQNNLDTEDKNKILSNITKEIYLPQITKSNRERSIKRLLMPIMAAAASISLLLLAYTFQSQSLEYSSQPGSIAHANLADGSVITLQGDSKLWMQDAFSDDEKRVVYLQNQAFFDISSSPKLGSSEFSVITDIATIDVLGTKFLVDEDDFRVTVVVEEGKVKVTPTNNRNDASPVYLTAGDKLIMKADHSVETEKLQSVKKYTSIKSGAIVFEGATTTDFIEDIEDYFGYSIKAPTALLTSKRAFDGTFPTQDIDLIMRSFSTTFGISYIREDQKITIEYPQKD